MMKLGTGSQGVVSSVETISLHAGQIEAVRKWSVNGVDRIACAEDPPDDPDLIAALYLPPIEPITKAYLRYCSVTDTHPLEVLVELVDALLTALDDTLRISPSRFLYYN